MSSTPGIIYHIPFTGDTINEKRLYVTYTGYCHFVTKTVVDRTKHKKLNFKCLYKFKTSVTKSVRFRIMSHILSTKPDELLFCQFLFPLIQKLTKPPETVSRISATRPSISKTIIICKKGNTYSFVLLCAFFRKRGLVETPCHSILRL